MKVEHPVHGDAIRGLNQSGPKTLSSAHNTQHSNRGKRGIGLQLDTPEGRAGVGLTFHHPSLEYPVAGSASVVDVSLLGVGSWIMAGDVITAALGHPQPSVALTPHDEPRNPLVHIYRTRDRRYITLVSLQADRDWPELCERIGLPELTDDPRFSSSALRMENRRECVARIDAAFATHTLDEWRVQLAGTRFVWEAMQTPGEVATDPQVVANDSIVPLDREDDGSLPPMLVTSAVQFDETSRQDLRRAPEMGEHTEQVLLDLGYRWDDITRLESEGIVS
jgi:crotonobetainyl-CoA:carnitine CoA-transferase CaiB-like acyl-CoA transferase